VSAWQTDIDEQRETTQVLTMKYLSQFMLTIVAAVAVAPGAMAAGSPESERQLGPHSAEKFVILQHLVNHRTIDPATRTSIALVLTVEQKMNGNQQEIMAKAAAHNDGPTGTLHSAEGIQVRIVEPGPLLASEVRKTQEPGEMKISKTISAPGGKYKTVTADVTIKSPEFPDKTFSLTIPGGK
jgi:hypothetical protein